MLLSTSGTVGLSISSSVLSALCHIVCSSVFFLVHTSLRLLCLLVGWPFYYYIVSMAIFFVLKPTLSHTCLITLAFVWVFF